MFEKCIARELLLVESQVDSYSDSYCCTYHWVVTNTQEAHHLYVSRNRRRTSELSVRVHTAESISHTVRSGTCSHVVWVQCTAGTTT